MVSARAFRSLGRQADVLKADVSRTAGQHLLQVPDAAGPVIAAIDTVDPNGLTPLTASVRAAAEVLEYRHRPGIVVLVTDGNETCGGRPCALGKELAISARDLTIHVIGFRVVADPFAWDSPEAGIYSDGASVAKCLSDGTGGSYVSTDTVDELAEALRETLGCALIGQRPFMKYTWFSKAKQPKTVLRFAIS